MIGNILIGLVGGGKGVGVLLRISHPTYVILWPIAVFFTHLFIKETSQIDPKGVAQTYKA
jgi:hypothetical protein